jgi:succinate dehydrogenase cytochrome b subunit
VDKQMVAAGPAGCAHPGYGEAEPHCLREAQLQGPVTRQAGHSHKKCYGRKSAEAAQRRRTQLLTRCIQQMCWYIDRQMAPPIETSAYKRTLYRGGPGMWSWILHRGSGLAVLGFLFLHVLDTSLVMFGPKAYNRMAHFYESALFRPLEVLLMFLVIYHAFNGLRVILVDFWPKGVRYEKRLNQVVMGITLVLFLPSAFVMLR